MQEPEDAALWGGLTQQMKGFDPGHMSSAMGSQPRDFQREK